VATPLPFRPRPPTGFSTAELVTGHISWHSLFAKITETVPAQREEIDVLWQKMLLQAHGSKDFKTKFFRNQIIAGSRASRRPQVIVSRDFARSIYEFLLIQIA
jgi:hypothetical protein